VLVAGTPEAIEKERKTVTELLSRLGLTVVVTAAVDESSMPGPSSGTAARAFVDLRVQTSPWLVVLRGDSSRELERRTLPTAASLEVSAEEVALVLYMAVESSLSTRAASAAATAPVPPASGSTDASAAPREEPPRREVTPPPPPPERRQPESDEPDEPENAPELVAPVATGPSGPFEIELSAFGGASTYSASDPLAGFGGALDVGSRPDKTRFSATLAGRAFLPKAMARDQETASLRAESGRLFAAAEWEIGEQTFVGLAVGGGVDRVTVTTGASTPGVWAAGTASRFDPMLGAVASAKFRISRSAAVFVATALDVDLAPHRYVTEDAAGDRTFFAPARVRPAAFLGLSFPLVGGPR
jgi:hypothetical protein